MNDASPVNNSFALDVQSLGNLRLQAKTDPNTALTGVAQQFEAVFTQMLLKSMRDTVDQNGPFDSEETKQFTSMLDEQLSQTLSKKGIGLAPIIERQLTPHKTPHAGGSGGNDAAATGGSAPGAATGSTPGAVKSPASDRGSARSSAKSFVNRLWPHAVEASQATGIPANFMIGHAALETGWGRSEIHGANGQPSYNLFGIKAGKSWTGPVVHATTTEYVNGVAQKVVEKFRSYSSYAAAFTDYARLLKNSPRYAAAVQGSSSPTAFAAGLQKAGYATDPMYADKLSRILQSSALRQSLIG